MKVWSPVRSAASEIDGVISTSTAVFTGSGVASRWRDVDFVTSANRVRASYVAGQLSTPKSGTVRSVPMAPDVAIALAGVGQRDRLGDDDDFEFRQRVGADARR